MNFMVTLVCGAFLVALWIDARLDARRPSTPTWQIAHVAAACVLLQLSAFGVGQIVGDHETLTRQFVAVFALLLPALLYTFVAGLWLVRTLAEVAFARR